jgi:hypothetical protein
MNQKVIQSSESPDTEQQRKNYTGNLLELKGGGKTGFSN